MIWCKKERYAAYFVHPQLHTMKSLEIASYSQYFITVSYKFVIVTTVLLLCGDIWPAREERAAKISGGKEDMSSDTGRVATIVAV
jgi:hypothetical protein